jgi:hypothetical protein
MNAQINHVMDETLKGLTPEDRERVLAYALELKSRQARGRPGRHLAAFAGTISKSDLAAISNAVAAGCEKVNGDEW